MNRRGFALMQVLIAIPIVAILSLTIATMMSNFAKQNRQLSQKLDTLEFKQLFMPVIADDTRCTNMLLGTSVEPTSNPSASLSELKTSATGSVLATANTTLPGSMSGVKISTIELADFVGTGTADEYNMNLKINWDPAGLVMALQPIIVARVVNVDPATKKITSCHAVPGGGGGGGGGPCTNRTCTGKGKNQPCDCNSGEHPVSCLVTYTTTTMVGKTPTTSTHVTSGNLTATGCTYSSKTTQINVSCCVN